MKIKKIMRTGHRGTESHLAEIKPQNWAGDAYRRVELERLAKVPKGKTMHLGRGIRTINAGNLPKPKPRPSTEGMTRITNRGTSSRASKNKGTKNQ
ncbi:MAG: hypothetical protein ACR2LL_12350 [Nitrosopumilus sp.]|uniref:hypothetical protein n=1 Tax=Nitrosopumilus sp. TaxID=2024843 RepID=UPI00293121A0|nr:hypothetical protein [Nitrosopumilus sp.]